MDKMDCRLVLENKMQRDIFYRVSSRNNILEKSSFIQDFSNNVQLCLKYPEMGPLLQKVNKKEKYCLKPSITENFDRLYIYIFDADSLTRYYNQNLDMQNFNDYHVIPISRELLDSLKWEITLDSLLLKKAIQ